MVIARGSGCGQPGRFSAAPQLNWRIRSWAPVIAWETSPQLNASLSSDLFTERKKLYIYIYICMYIYNEYEFEKTPGDSEGQGSLVCCNSWGCKGSDTT